MFSIFISSKALLNLLHKEKDVDPEEWTDWYAIIRKQSNIYLDKDIQALRPNDAITLETLDGLTQDQAIAILLMDLSQAVNLCCSPSPINYNIEIANNPSILLQDCERAYLLDVDNNEAKRLQSEYGVICQSTKDLTHSILAHEIITFPVIPSRKLEDWNDLFLDEIPMNTLIIIDRYLFAYDSTVNRGYLDAVENIKQILNAALPSSLGCDFHVIILFSENAQSISLDNNFNKTNVENDIDNFIQNMHLNYAVEIEYLSVNDSHVPGFEDTHNPKLISNYYIASAEKSFKAFDSQGIGIYLQDLTLKTHYANGLRNSGTPPIEHHKYLLESLLNMIHFSQGNMTFATRPNMPPFILVFQHTILPTSNIKNRLLQ